MQHGPESAANISIISGPYSGKTMLMDMLYHKFPLVSNRIIIPFSLADFEGFDKVEKDNKGKIVFIDDCHMLYKRKVGGFEALGKLLDYIATHPDYLFITSWVS
jgi:hypothetical protein